VEVNVTPIDGLVIIRPKIFADERGSFSETYNTQSFQAAGIKREFVQDNQSVSHKNVVRGLHFQAPPFAQAKLVRVVRGSVIDVAVDIRKNSPTYGRHYSILLSAENGIQFFIPEGFAHGFAALEDHTIFQYKCSNFYNKTSEGSLLWNDPALNIQWTIENPIVSAKDLEASLFADLKSPF
jgi:dTDP-4-dehydrorhamnose 3,5-epimerase